MSALDTASKFFHSCEGLQGWDGCKEFVADNASFTAQCEPLTEIDSVEGYCNWMAAVGSAVSVRATSSAVI